MPTAKSIWGIHDFVPDYTAFSSLDEFISTPDHKIKGGYSGCGWHRIVMPLNALAEHGWKISYTWGRPPKEFDEYRIVIGQRTDKFEALPDWRRMRARHRLVYELDDDVFTVEAVNAQAHRVYRDLTVQEAVRHSAETADILTVSTPVLAEVMRKNAAQTEIRVLKNCVPGALLDMQRPRDRRHLIVGWSGGASHGADLAMIAAPLRNFLDRNKNARLHLMGVNYEETIGRKCRYTQWIPARPDLKYYHGYDFDVALCPLTGTVFDQSKSNIKALEAMSLGIPVLASDVEPYRDLVIDGVNGYLIRKRNEWGKRLQELASDTQAREEMSAKARETARAWTIEANWHKWAAVYEELL